MHDLGQIFGAIDRVLYILYQYMITNIYNVKGRERYSTSVCMMLKVGEEVVVRDVLYILSGAG